MKDERKHKAAPKKARLYADRVEIRIGEKTIVLPGGKRKPTQTKTENGE